MEMRKCGRLIVILICVLSDTYYGVTKPQQTQEQAYEQLCECPAGPGKCAEDCINRCTFNECPPECGEDCLNRKIQKYEWSPGIKRYLTQEKGYGVKTTERIKKGDFILEYVGEIVTDAVFKERMHTIYATDTHHYCLHLDGGLVIDGHRAGGEGRFVNHSCEPNCEMQKWSVNGHCRMALFALRDILPEEELSYDYNFSLFNPAEGQVRTANIQFKAFQTLSRLTTLIGILNVFNCSLVYVEVPSVEV
jgi:histone-lysine N-methyltransferase ASH1L